MPSRRMPAGSNPGPSPQPTGLGAGKPGSNAQTMPQPIQQGQPPAAMLPPPQPPSPPLPKSMDLRRAALPQQTADTGQPSSDMLDPSMILKLLSSSGMNNGSR